MDDGRCGNVCAAGFVMLGTVITYGCMTPAVMPLNGNAWRLVSYDNRISNVPVLDGTNLPAEFIEDMTGSSAGYNHDFALCTADTSLQCIEGIGMLRYCTTLAVMEQKGTYLTLLGPFHLHEIERVFLVLSNDNGRSQDHGRILFSYRFWQRKISHIQCRNN